MHYPRKAWFDFYSDTLYYKLFSAWDVLGHLIDAQYALKVKHVDFGRAVTALGKSQQAPNVYADLAQIASSPHFQKAKDIRNDITHNYLPNVPGLTVSNRHSPTWSLSPKRYVYANEIVENVDHVMRLFGSTLTCLS